MRQGAREYREEARPPIAACGSHPMLCVASMFWMRQNEAFPENKREQLLRRYAEDITWSALASRASTFYAHALGLRPRIAPMDGPNRQRVSRGRRFMGNEYMAAACRA